MAPHFISAILKSARDEMEAIQESIGSLLVIGIVLGIPIAMVFIVGSYLYWAGRSDPLNTWNRAGRLRGFGPDGTHYRGQQPRCWQMKHCPPERRGACAANTHPDLPCWQAAKIANGGRIKAECTNCELFLSPWEPAKSGSGTGPRSKAA